MAISRKKGAPQLALVTVTALYSGGIDSCRDEAIRAVATHVLGLRSEIRAHGSGTWMASGVRDHSWELTEKRSADAHALTKALRRTIRGLRVTVKTVKVPR